MSKNNLYINQLTEKLNQKYLQTKWRSNNYNGKLLKGEDVYMKKHPDYLLPLFKGKAALSLLETINHSHIKSYTDKEKENTELEIRELLKKRILFK